MSSRVPVMVGDVMAAQTYAIDGMATVAEAINLMQQHEVNSLTVNQRDATDELGLLLVSDIARHVIATNRSPERVHVYEIMSKPTLTLPPDMQARYAVRLLVRFDLSRAIVVDQHRAPIGLVTLRDLVLGRERAS